MKAKLALENGLILGGESFAATGEVTGELVFTTGLTGYQEILTDPSYCGQIVTMTSPIVGNTGVNPIDLESPAPQVSGFIVREYIDFPSNFRATESLGSWLKSHNVIAIQGIDTRQLTRIIRDSGAMRAIISTTDAIDQSLMEKVLKSPQMKGRDLASQVSCKQAYVWDQTDSTEYSLRPQICDNRGKEKHFHAVVYDFGVKRNILRRLAAYGCRITVVPSGFPADSALSLNPDGILLSNGPGDPAAVGYAVESIKNLIGKKPIFGICLGHQLLALALGGKTYKLKFGHRGLNHPVKNLKTNNVEITSQNHGFSIDIESLKSSLVEATHINLNDGTNEGLCHRELPVFSVQYHPEASPGPHDSDYLFSQFIGMMKENAG